jgi:hypothetical protein
MPEESANGRPESSWCILSRALINRTSLLARLADFLFRHDEIKTSKWWRSIFFLFFGPKAN